MIEWKGQLHAVSISANGKLSELKEGVKTLTNLEPNQQDLVHKGTRLSGDDLPMSALGISSHISAYKKLHLTVRNGDSVVPLTANRAMTVGQLKQMAFQRFHLSSSNNDHYCLHLAEGQREVALLDDDSTLNRAGVNNYSALKLVLI